MLHGVIQSPKGSAIQRRAFPVRRTAASAMPRYRAGWTLSARTLVGMRLRLSSRPISIERRGSFA